MLEKRVQRSGGLNPGKWSQDPSVCFFLEATSMNHSKLMFAKSKIIDNNYCSLLSYELCNKVFLIKITFPQKDHNVFDH